MGKPFLYVALCVQGRGLLLWHDRLLGIVIRLCPKHSGLVSTIPMDRMYRAHVTDPAA